MTDPSNADVKTDLSDVGLAQEPNWLGYTDLEFANHEIEVDANSSAVRHRELVKTMETVPAWRAGWPTKTKRNQK